MYIGVGSKLKVAIKAMCCAKLSGKCPKSTFRLQNEAFFSTVCTILASFAHIYGHGK